VGLEDRDWYREEPSRAWKEQGSSPARTSTSPAGSAPRLFRRAERRLHRWAVPLAIGAAIPILTAVGWQNRQPLGDMVRSVSSRVNDTPGPPLSAPLPVTNDAKIVHLRSRPGLDVPARQVTRWWITDRRFGRIGVYVTVGTTPREALAVALAERGYQVVP
jgi:hypothetical protein